MHKLLFSEEEDGRVPEKAEVHKPLKEIRDNLSQDGSRKTSGVAQISNSTALQQETGEFEESEEDNVEMVLFEDDLPENEYDAR